MNCTEARTHILASLRGRLDRDAGAEVAAHLERCRACADANRAERALDEVLAGELPRFTAPASLRRRLALMAGPAAQARLSAGTEGETTAARRPLRWRAALRSRPVALAASIVIVLAAGAWWQARRLAAATDPLLAELVTDHLRVLARDHPVDVESHGAHEVKPWFEGRLDFAPVVPAPPVADLLLRGGAVGYVLDQKAAVVLYTLRRHAVTMLVSRAEGAAWSEAASGPPRLHERSLRGFHVAWWRSGDLAYALVSDANPAEIHELALRFAAESSPNGTR